MFAWDLLKTRAMIRILLGVLSLAATAQAQAPRTAERPLVISFADVGQGDLVTIITPEGKHVIIDAGRSGDAAQRILWETPTDTIDLLVASHNHQDHIGGIPWIFQRFHVRAFMDNGVPHTTASYRQAIVAARNEPGLMYLEATARTVRVGSVALRILPPSLRDREQNNNSVGILVEHGEFRALLTGDAEEEQLAHWLATASIPRVHVLKASHHGARNGTTGDWIRATQPRAVVVSVGGRNGFGHPAPEVILAWQQAGAKVYRTDETKGVFLAAQRDGSFHMSRGDAYLTADIKLP